MLFMKADCCLNKAGEQWVGCVGLGLKFGMKLHPDKPRVCWDFRNFYKVFVWVDATELDAFCFKFFPKGIVEFISVSVSFRNYFYPIGFSGETTFQ